MPAKKMTTLKKKRRRLSESEKIISEALNFGRLLDKACKNPDDPESIKFIEAMQGAVKLRPEMLSSLPPKLRKIVA